MDNFCSPGSVSTDPTEFGSNPDPNPQPYAQVEFLPALQSATGKQFPAPGEELESADALQFLVDLCAANGVQVAPPLTLPRVLGRLLSSVAGPECLSRIRFFSIPDLHQRIKYFNPIKMVSKL